MQHLALITPQNIHSDRQDGRPDAAQVNAYESEIVNNKSSNEYEPQEREYPNIIPEVEDESIVNVFCFGAFADKMTGVVYDVSRLGRYCTNVLLARLTKVRC
jgi:hypothetical protein